MTSVLNMTMTQEYTSLSRATINRRREIGDFPQALQLTGNRIGFYVSELDEWLAGRPRKSGPEVNDNKRRVRCPRPPKNLRRLAYKIRRVEGEQTRTGIR